MPNPGQVCTLSPENVYATKGNIVAPMTQTQATAAETKAAARQADLDVTNHVVTLTNTIKIANP